MFYNDTQERLLSAFNFFWTYWKGDEVFFEGRWFEAKRHNMAHYPPEAPERENAYWKMVENQ